MKPAAKGIGQLAREAGLGFERRYFYDALARPVATAETHGFHVFSTSRGYDLYSRPESLTYPSGFATRQVYNASGHLSEVQNGANLSTLYWRALQVNARGQVTQEALGNGVVTERAFEADSGLIDGITSTFGASGDVQKAEFDFDLIGNLTARRDRRLPGPFMNFVTKPLKSSEMQGGRGFERLSAWVHARCLSNQAQRRRFGLISGCSRRLMKGPGLSTAFSETFGYNTLKRLQTPSTSPCAWSKAATRCAST